MVNNSLQKIANILTKPPKNQPKVDQDFDVHSIQLSDLFHPDTTIQEAFSILNGAPLEQLSWLSNKVTARRFHLVANRLYDGGRYAEALEWYKIAYKLSPEDDPFRDARVQEIQELLKSAEQQSAPVEEQPSVFPIEKKHSTKLLYLKDAATQDKEKCRDRIAKWDRAFERGDYKRALQYFIESEKRFSYDNTKKKIETTQIKIGQMKQISVAESKELLQELKSEIQEKQRLAEHEKKVALRKAQQEEDVIKFKKLVQRRKKLAKKRAVLVTAVAKEITNLIALNTSQILPSKEKLTAMLTLRVARKRLPKKTVAHLIAKAIAQNETSQGQKYTGRYGPCFPDDIKARFKDAPNAWFSENKKKCRRLIFLWDEYMEDKKMKEALQAYKDAYSLLLGEQKPEYTWLNKKIWLMENLLAHPELKQELNASDREGYRRKDWESDRKRLNIWEAEGDEEYWSNSKINGKKDKREQIKDYYGFSEDWRFIYYS